MGREESSLNVNTYGEVTFMVNPDVLKTQAEQTRISIKRLMENLADIGKIISGTGSYWDGEAGEAMRKLYSDKQAIITEVIDNLLRHPDNLEAIAMNYEGIEKITIDNSVRLNGNIIE